MVGTPLQSVAVGDPLPVRKAYQSVGVALLVTVMTLGIFDIFWNARQVRTLNAFLAEERFNLWRWVLLTVGTFGLYHVYHEYRVGQAILEIQRDANCPETPRLPLLCMVLSLIGLPVIADAVQQRSINQLYR